LAKQNKKRLVAYWGHGFIGPLNPPMDVIENGRSNHN